MRKKLKLLNLLSLNTKNGKFTIKDLKCNYGTEEEHPTTVINLAPFDSVLDDIFIFEVNEHDSDVLIFISGYVSNSLCHKIKCDICSNRLCSDKN